MRRKIIAGNWKMNGSLAFMQDYLADFKEALAVKGIVKSDVFSVVIAPPFVLLSEAITASKSSVIEVAAQNVSSYESGAYTGEVSSSMLSDLSCSWCLVGHSERRALFGDTDVVVLSKIERLLEQNISPILCVGETLAQREAGQAEETVAQQLDAVFDHLTESQLRKLVVAYEPVWAIGTGKTASPEQAQAMHESIRLRVAGKSKELADSLVILYGGSVNAQSAEALFAKKDIDGGLVGGASLKVNDFVLICEHLAASK